MRERGSLKPETRLVLLDPPYDLARISKSTPLDLLEGVDLRIDGGYGLRCVSMSLVSLRARLDA